MKELTKSILGEDASTKDSLKKMDADAPSTNMAEWINNLAQKLYKKVKKWGGEHEEWDRKWTDTDLRTMQWGFMHAMNAQLAAAEKSKGKWSKKPVTDFTQAVDKLANNFDKINQGGA